LNEGNKTVHAIKKNKGTTIMVVMFSVLSLGISTGVPAGDEKPALVEPRAVVRMLNNREKIVFINLASSLECLDTRIPSSLCMECGEGAEKAGAWPQDREAKIVFYDGNATAVPGCEPVQIALTKGYKRIYLLKGGLTAWKRAGYDVESIDRIPRRKGMAVKPERLKHWLAANNSAVLVDIRRPGDFKAGSIEGAVNVPLASLTRAYQDFYRDRPLLLIDQDGTRSFLAAGYLHRKGLEKIYRLEGGMAAWQEWNKRRKP